MVVTIQDFLVDDISFHNRKWQDGNTHENEEGDTIK
jgi:hypothetical protein